MLSVHGWFVAITGIVLVAVGVITALQAALAMGIMMTGAVVYAIGNAVWIHRALSRSGVQVIRRSVPAEPQWGTPTIITVIATGPRLPLALIWRTNGRVRDRVHPNVASYEGTVNLELSRSGWQASYQVRPLARGVWSLGPLKFRFSDVMGLVNTRVTHTIMTSIVVRPRVAHLDHAIRESSGHASDRITDRAVGSLLPDSDDSLLREYVPGDDVRRVHWPTTARRRTLMVKNEESMPMTPITIILDGQLVPSVDIASTTSRRLRRNAASDAAVVSAHWPVDLAATLAASLRRHNTKVHLRISALGYDDALVESDEILDTLTELPDLTGISDSSHLVDLIAGAGDGVTIVLMAPTPSAVATQLARTATDRRTGTSVAVIVAEPDQNDAVAATRRSLSEHGWQVIEASLPNADLAAIARAVVGA